MVRRKNRVQRRHPYKTQEPQTPKINKAHPKIDVRSHVSVVLSILLSIKGDILVGSIIAPLNQKLIFCVYPQQLILQIQSPQKLERRIFRTHNGQILHRIPCLCPMFHHPSSLCCRWCWRLGPVPHQRIRLLRYLPCPIHDPPQ